MGWLTSEYSTCEAKVFNWPYDQAIFKEYVKIFKLFTFGGFRRWIFTGWQSWEFRLMMPEKTVKQMSWFLTAKHWIGGAMELRKNWLFRSITERNWFLAIFLVIRWCSARILHHGFGRVPPPLKGDNCWGKVFPQGYSRSQRLLSSAPKATKFLKKSGGKKGAKVPV